jgi:hypothetical protein
MSTIRLRFKDIDYLVLGDLEVSREIPIQDMLSLILTQLGLEGEKGWKLVLEQNRSVDPRYSFTEVGARDGSLIRVVPANLSTMPLLQEIQLTIADPHSQTDASHRKRRTPVRKQDLDAVTRLLKRQRNVLVVGNPGVDKPFFIRQVLEHIAAPNASIYLDDFQSAKSVLRDIARTLHKRYQLTYISGDSDSKTIRQRLAHWQIDDLVTLIYDSLQGHGYLLTIENLDTITPTGITALQKISQVSTILAAASSDCLDRLHPILDQFERIELQKSGYLNPIWIIGVFAALFLTFFLINQVAEASTAYIVTGGLFLLLLVLRAILWKGPRPKIKNSQD